MGRIGAALLGGVLVAGLATLPTGAARAEGAGRYVVQGTNPNGTRYSGTATLSEAGRGVWRLNWNVAGTSYSGFGIGDGRVLAFSYTSGNSSGVAMYTARPDGSYAGVWAERGSTSTGAEDLLPR